MVKAAAEETCAPSPHPNRQECEPPSADFQGRASWRGRLVRPLEGRLSRKGQAQIAEADLYPRDRSEYFGILCTSPMCANRGLPAKLARLLDEPVLLKGQPK